MDMNSSHSTIVLEAAPFTSWLHSVPYSLYAAILLGLAYLTFSKNGAVSMEKAPGHWTAHHWPIIGSSLRFFSNRRDMMLRGRDVASGGSFSFFVGNKHVVAVSGDKARQAFFENRGMSLPQGFVDLLTGKLPSAKNDADYGLHGLIKPLLHLTQTKEITQKVAPINDYITEFCDDKLQAAQSDNAEWQVMNIWGDIPLLMYKAMQQCVGFQEIAQDEALLKSTFSMYRQFEKTTSHSRIVFPWLVTPRHIWRLVHATRLYIALDKILNKRKEEGAVRVEDAVQFLLDKGESNYNVVEFIFTVFVAGLTTTTFTCTWILIFLSHFPEWKTKCQQEIDQVMAKHRSSGDGPQTPGGLLKKLSIQEWEGDFPVLGAVLRETLRLQLPGTMFRRNGTNSDIPISEGEVIPAGSYAAYTVAYTHLDPELYPDPFKFDPSRHLGAAGEKTEPHTYLGWGSGRHLCAGMRLAKLLMTMVTVHMLARFDTELCSKDGGENKDGLPVWDRNALRMEISEDPVYLRYRARTSESSTA